MATPVLTDIEMVNHGMVTGLRDPADSSDAANMGWVQNQIAAAMVNPGLPNDQTDLPADTQQLFDSGALT